MPPSEFIRHNETPTISRDVYPLFLRAMKIIEDSGGGGDEYVPKFRGGAESKRIS